ncbi:MAG: enoyl-CoA hydratase/isomerase family protein [Alphaproteobacteria bacterium]|nr:enoyl-CoA hydratase/isomerase family protein [Alphaproteobacteria bacterium]
MNQDSIDPSEQILTHKRGGLGVITLNRLEALNALSLEMIRQIAMILKRWESDDEVSTVAFIGAGDRAFCAGGDLKSFYRAGMDYRRGQVDLSVPSLYFGEEYSLNKQIFHYPKPTIAIMDGVTMGGGYGIAGHCQYRFVTENTLFAMPEVAIGLFPDVGSVYHLLRAPNNWGRYLAITGVQIKAGDVLAAGLADDYIQSGDVSAFLDGVASQGIENVIGKFSSDKPKAIVFADHGDLIRDVFVGCDVLAMCSRLRENGLAWAMEILSVILSRAPISVMVTAKHLEDMVGAEFDDVIAFDYTLAQNFVGYPDLYEGIRAVLIDRQHAPIWQPETLEDVRDEQVERFFKAGDKSLYEVKIFN